MIYQIGGKKLKRLLAFILTLSFIYFTGCQQTDEKNIGYLSSAPQISHLPNNSVSLEMNSFSPLLFYENNPNFRYAYIVCGFWDGKYQDMNKFKYSGKFSSEYIGNYTQVQADFINMNESITMFDSNGKQFESKMNDIFCGGNVIDDYAHVYTKLEHISQLEGNRWLGIYSSKTPYPRQPIYSENSIVVDLDGNGQDDKINWTYNKAKAQDYGNDIYDYVVSALLNGKQFTYKNPVDQPLKKGDLSVFVADINGDGLMELIIYNKLVAIQSSLSIFQVNDGNIQNMMEYVFTVGP